MCVQSYWGESGTVSAKFERTDSHKQQHSGAGELAVTVTWLFETFFFFLLCTPKWTLLSHLLVLVVKHL